MKPLTGRAAAVLLALAGTFAVAALSRVPYEPTHPADALIRISWRTPGELVQECRRLTAEELERLPVHMRREEVCEGRMVPYRLRIVLNGTTVIDQVVRAAGAREDRPLYVYHDLPVVPGEHDIHVTWTPERSATDASASAAASDPSPSAGTGGVSEPGAADPPVTGMTGDGRAARSTAEAGASAGAPGGRRGAGPLELEARLALERRDVALITYDVDRRTLVARARLIRSSPPP